MIRHICMFRMKDVSLVDEFIERAQVLKTIPQIKEFEIVRNDPATPESNYHVSLIFDFDSVEELKTYSACDTHVNYAKWVAENMESRACIDYEF